MIRIFGNLRARSGERFHKADTSRECSGSGLRLAIAKKIVELHHGTVRVKSQPGAGATYTVVLPV